MGIKYVFCDLLIEGGPKPRNLSSRTNERTQRKCESRIEVSIKINSES